MAKKRKPQKKPASPKNQPPKNEEPRPAVDGREYEQIKERARRRSATLSESGRDIGDLPAVVDPQRKERARHDTPFALQTYFPRTFALKWSDDHKRVIARIDTAVKQGGLFAMAMPRGSGKTSLAEACTILALVFGWRSFVALIGSDEKSAEEMLDSIKIELETNETLAADFPEVVYPIHALGGIANRCAGQLYRGERTHITWTQKEIVLPTLAGSPASGAVIRVAGITGRIRGMKAKRASGESIRPDLVCIDDPQTDESARSLTQCATREAILSGAILGLSGPGKKIAGIMPCTVIRPGDVADSILNRDKHPEWNGERTKMVYQFPANRRLWETYKSIRAEGLKAGDNGKAGNEFYAANRGEMDAGSVVAWPERHNSDELSAIQHAMNLMFRDEDAFFAEYQNEPRVKAEHSTTLSHDEICRKLSGHSRRLVPGSAQKLTAFIDVQKTLLYWSVVAWEPNFSGYVIDYGAWPEQPDNYFALRDARITLANVGPTGAGFEGQLYAGMTAAADHLLGREWQLDGGGSIRISRCLIDANWGNSTDLVYRFCRESRFAAGLTPAHGKYYGASSIPLSKLKKRNGDRVGLNWKIPATTGRRAIRHVVFDSNWWKSFLHARLAVAVGDPGTLSFFGNNPDVHRMIADHLRSEYRVTTEGRGRTVEEWALIPGTTENHFLDCLTGAAVAASIEGVELPSFEGEYSRKKKSKTRLSDLQKKKRRWT